MNVEIRRMTANDVPAVHKIEKKVFKDAWTFEQLLSETEPDAYRAPHVVVYDSKIIGFTCIWALAGEVHINNFAIDPDFQRKGLGLKLLNFIFDAFKESGFFYLEVRESNEAAISLYEKCGFRLDFKRKAYYKDGEDALVMIKVNI
jgi:ribosomal-protein-alanine N-acetyltransferase